MKEQHHERVSRRATELQEELERELRPKGFRLKTEGHFESENRMWKVYDAEGNRFGGVLHVTDRALAGNRDLAADLRRQDWLEMLKEHDRCWLDERGVLSAGGEPLSGPLR